jgi:adenine-specific DNA-methyltransferase
MRKDALIMDFFAGSGTTFESVCALNKKDGGTRHTILIQKPEPLQESSPYKTIADLCWARIQKNAAQFGQACTRITMP